MFHSRQLNKEINTIHERALRLIYQNYTFSFTELLSKDSSLTVHQRKLQKLVTEMFKVKIEIAPEIMKDIFEIDKNHIIYDMTF